MVVTPTGTVASAIPFSRNEEWYETAAARAMTWRFVPFKRQGSAIYATFSLVVRIVPPEKRPEQHISFPVINDWKSLRITLQRTALGRSYHAYKLTIFGDGRVLYHCDNEGVGYSGKQDRGHVLAEAVRQLVNLFKIADYFNLSDRYVALASDAPAFRTSISFDHGSKSVVDYAGVAVGMPEVVRRVEDGIDLLAGPKVWHERQRGTPNLGDWYWATASHLPSERTSTVAKSRLRKMAPEPGFCENRCLHQPCPKLRINQCTATSTLLVSCLPPLASDSWSYCCSCRVATL